MKLTIISYCYPPELIVSAFTCNRLAESLSEKGHDVNVITTFPSGHGGAIFDGYKIKAFATSSVQQSLKIMRCFSFISKKSTILSKTAENISFGVFSSLALLFSRKPDIVYLNTWPIFSQGLNAIVCKLKNIPYVVCVQDIYPESLIAQNRINENSLISKILRLVDKKITKSAKALVVISEGFADVYVRSRGILQENIEVIPNFIEDIFGDDILGDNYLIQCSIPSGSFVYVYGGNIGAAAGVEKVIETFNQMDNKRYLIIAGAGSRLEDCKKIAQGNNNIKFISPWPKDETSKLLNSGDIALLPTIGSQSLASVPSKLISYMLAAKPVLAFALPNSDLAKIINKAGCGWVVMPNEIDSFKSLMLMVEGISKEKLIEMGEAGRIYAKNNFTEEVCLPELIGVIERVSNN